MYYFLSVRIRCSTTNSRLISDMRHRDSYLTPLKWPVGVFVRHITIKLEVSTFKLPSYISVAVCPLCLYHCIWPIHLYLFREICSFPWILSILWYILMTYSLTDVLHHPTSIIMQDCSKTLDTREWNIFITGLNFHHWLHWKLSKWQLSVQPAMDGFSRSNDVRWCFCNQRRSWKIHAGNNHGGASILWWFAC